MVKKPESRLQLRIRKALEQEFGGYWRKIHGSMYQAGIPDLVGCVQGLYLALEVKVGNAKASQLQVDNIEEIKAAGGLAAIVRSVDDALTQVRQYLEEAGRLPETRGRVRTRRKNSGSVFRAGHRQDLIDFGSARKIAKPKVKRANSRTIK